MIQKDSYQLCWNYVWKIFRYLKPFLGTGKLKILRHASYIHDERYVETCIDRIKFPMIMKDIIEVVGTFVNGTLHGTAKLLLEGQNTVIANFDNGTLHGMT